MPFLALPQGKRQRLDFDLEALAFRVTQGGFARVIRANHEPAFSFSSGFETGDVIPGITTTGATVTTGGAAGAGAGATAGTAGFLRAAVSSFICTESFFS